MVLDGRGSRLGVMIRDLEPSEAAKAPDGGVTVDEVTPDSPAQAAGVRAGDVVVQYDGERVRSARQFARLVQETPDGRTVPLTVLRDGRRETLSATPEARAFSWSMDIDGDRIRREVERGLEGLREFRADGPAFDFRFDGRDLLSDRIGGRRLGVTLDTLSGQLADYFGASDGGALITSVQEDSPAAKAGLKAGDVITSIAGEPVRDARAVVDRIARTPGGEVSIGYLRNRQGATATATVEPRDDGPRRRPVRPARFMRPA
jgi:serine protease Do